MNRLALSILATIAVCSAANAQTIAPFKDELFAYPGIVAAEDGGAYRVVGYDEMRDINGRDEEPERRVQRKYIDTGVRGQQSDLVAATGAGKVAHVAVGRSGGAALIVVYLHGQGGSRKQGVDDFTFGGNFNRIKNLVAKAGGLYLSPDFSDFGEGGAAQVAALIDAYAAQSPAAKVVVACGSMGGMLCWRLAAMPKVASRLGGLMLMGSLWDDGFLSSPAFKARVPLFLAQGSLDRIFPADKMKAFYRSIRANARDYPVRMVVFETGGHGTPIRMTDWRETLNWLLAQR